ncbi:hypothetical protein MUO66_08030 [Candidatus Bathyarchaeota archaeon]|nr:hypothetical protein [Candidatus Bathyarchaeota archaeon]
MENSPDSVEDAVDILARAGYLKAENDKVTVSLDSANTLNIQPKGTIFGAKVKVEESGLVTPTLTFDTKKLRDKPNYVPPKDLVDEALEDFWENTNV